MLYYKSCQETFEEVPFEISLSLGISSCPNHCKGCSSPWLQECGGIPLTIDELSALLNKHPFVTCVTFLGGDYNLEYLKLLLFKCQNLHKKTCLYTGATHVDESIYMYLDYLKLGPWIESKGPLSSPTTNQKFYQIVNGKLIDKTFIFQNKNF